jgi:hypothetical protein
MSERTIPALGGSSISNELEVGINTSGIVVQLLSLSDILGKGPLLPLFKKISFRVFNKIRRWAVIPRSDAPHQDKGKEKSGEEKKDPTNHDIPRDDVKTEEPSKTKNCFVKMYEPLFIISPCVNKMGDGNMAAGSEGANVEGGKGALRDNTKHSAMEPPSPSLLHGCYDVVGSRVCSCWADSKGEILNLFTANLPDILRPGACLSLDWSSVVNWVLHKGNLLNQLLNLGVEVVVIAKVGEAMETHELAAWKQACETCGSEEEGKKIFSIAVVQFVANQNFQTMANPMVSKRFGDDDEPRDFSIIVIPKSSESWFKFTSQECPCSGLGYMSASGLLISEVCGDPGGRGGGRFLQSNSNFRVTRSPRNFCSIEISVLCVEGAMQSDNSGDNWLVRCILRQYFDLSWLTIDPVSCERTSVFPIHIASLLELIYQLKE